MIARLYGLAVLALLLAGCAGGGGGQVPPSTSAERDSDGAAASGSAPAQTGRYHMAGDAYPVAPPDVSRVADAVPRLEPLSRAGNRPTYEVWGNTYRVLPDASGYVREGTASWYGEKFHGYATSNGEIYDMYKMTAAHRSLPLPTFVRVTSLDNGRSVIVRVNDRGPFHNDREIDLSYAAAARLDILDRGTGRVRVEAIDVERWLAEHGSGASGDSDAAERAAGEVAPAARRAAGRVVGDAPAAAGDGPVYLQVAALGSAESAQALQARLEAELSRPVRIAAVSGTHRVQVGPLAGADQVEPVRHALRRAGFEQSFVVNGAD